MTTLTSNIKLTASWKSLLVSEFSEPYMQTLRTFLQDEKKAGKTIYPKGGQMFAALNATEVGKVKVIILGQDPYHGPDQAHGLCFSVKANVAIPPSLQNIYKALHADLGMVAPSHGSLHGWANQGVLLLNSVLSVESNCAASHQGKGWEQFTDAIIAKLNQQCDNLVFMLWGSYAQKKGQYIDASKHLVLKAPHPSPLSAYRGFFQCQHFSKANNYLQKHGKDPINWQHLPLK